MYILDTIAAIATPLGAGGIGIVRISGPDSESIGNLIFSGSTKTTGGGFQSHRLFYGRFFHPSDRSMIDEGMCVLMRAPRSYTREDVLELHCHGGYLIVRKLLDACVAAGARLAAPGEFTRRAFLNGRIDLAQAESISDLISSSTDRALALAQSQREGVLSQSVAELRPPLVEALSLIEAYIDFPEDEVDPVVIGSVLEKITTVRSSMQKLLDTFSTGKVLREGVSVLLLGRPNAGKSSLLNAITGTERAIVSHLPGTTRDLIEETVSLNGLPVKIIDAAGIRSHHFDSVEQEGVRRALDKVAAADLVLLLVDGSKPIANEDIELALKVSETPYLLVITKSDLPQMVDTFKFANAVGVCSVSAKSSIGIDQLATLIYDYFVNSSVLLSDGVAVVSAVRHRDVLFRAVSSLDLFAQNQLDCYPPELLSLDLREALSALGEITGEATTDEILDLIFSSFCIGK